MSGARPATSGRTGRHALTTARTANDLELLFTRRFDAPRALVYKAWTDPALFARWWGPNDFTTPVCQWQPRPGAAWRIVMRAPDGAENPIKGEFDEVVANERLVLTMDCSECPPEWQAALNGARSRPDAGRPLRFRVTVTFADRDGGTELSILSRFETTDDVEANIKLGSADGWAQSLERLESLIATDTTPAHAATGADTPADATEARTTEREIIVSRVLQAPRGLVFQAWTDPQHVVKWWGPDGFTSSIQRMDVRPGGEWNFVMHGPDGTDYVNRIVFVEVLPPERLVYDHVSGPKFRATITFEELGARRTKLTMRSVFETAAELRRTIESFGAVEGAKQHIGRLAGYVATM